MLLFYVILVNCDIHDEIYSSRESLAIYVDFPELEDGIHSDSDNIESEDDDSKRRQRINLWRIKIKTQIKSILCSASHGIIYFLG